MQWLGSRAVASSNCTFYQTQQGIVPTNPILWIPTTNNTHNFPCYTHQPSITLNNQFFFQVIVLYVLLLCPALLILVLLCVVAFRSLVLILPKHIFHRASIYNMSSPDVKLFFVTLCAFLVRKQIVVQMNFQDLTARLPHVFCLVKCRWQDSVKR